LLAGIVAILGWAAVIMYVTESDPSANPLTRSYVDYLTSNAILIGVEVDKVLSISFVTIILAAAVNGSKNLLIDSVTEKATNRQLSRFFDKTVAEGIRSKASDIVPGKGEERVATILTIDIRGFSRLVSDVDANRVMELLFAYQSRVLPIIRKHGGTIDKFMGDGIMVIFGVDDSVDKPALRALNAASDLLLDYPNWNHQDEVIKQIGPIRIGIGIASGVIAWGAVGFEDRLEMTAIGSPVNRAAKLEKQNSVLGSECICDVFTWETAHSEGYDGSLSGERTTGKIDGLSEKTDFIIVSHKGASRKDRPISMVLDQPVNVPKA